LLVRILLVGAGLEAIALARDAIELADDAVIALAPAIGCMTRLRRHFHRSVAEPALAQRSGRLDKAGIKARQRVFRRRLDHRAE